MDLVATDGILVDGLDRMLGEIGISVGIETVGGDERGVVYIGDDPVDILPESYSQSTQENDLALNSAGRTLPM